jgi:hypothetical protein
MSEEDKAITFQAQTYGIRTLIDGGVRLSLDIIGASPELVAALFSTKQPGIFLEVAAVAIKQKSAEIITNLDENETIEEEAKTSAPRVDRGRLIKQRD